ncbi:phosphotransferase [Mycoplasma sp. 'Moose RK']|uniref:phosphotransferase n=1 Tax=Mycoplasma sp. 'Moose RK' TaxID=2780095 RepID=UPI0018C1E433|nr:phosphotransferase [Mycoplasma sp. 'Moose RK']MBG0730497.1 phosphotransferase [Mycoplasma sp. 'Moose RK']
MKKILIGFTNESFRCGSNFIQNKNYNGMNHKIDYQILSNFKFVPKLISNSENKIIWEWIEGKPVELNTESLKNIANQLRKIHNSNLNFPPSNHASRIKKYLKILSEKGIKIEIINKFYSFINKVLKNMDKSTPLHNDLWLMNMVEKDRKIYFLDWEYASKGDKYFDLAYFIESAKLNQEQEKNFLDFYGPVNYKYVLTHKILVLYLIILWVNVQETKHFDDKPYKDKLEILHSELANWRE